MNAEPLELIEFGRAAGPERWFSKDDDFDRRFRDEFSTTYEAAARGELDSWLEQPQSALALVLLLDQYPRNSFRNTPRMYATDGRARDVTSLAIASGHDRAVAPELQFFFYLPFAHSESLEDQERSVALTERLGPELLKHAHGHRDVVRRFGRFPHRNAILGRASTPEELEFLTSGGFSG